MLRPIVHISSRSPRSRTGGAADHDHPVRHAQPQDVIRMLVPRQRDDIRSSPTDEQASRDQVGKRQKKHHDERSCRPLTLATGRRSARGHPPMHEEAPSARLPTRALAPTQPRRAGRARVQQSLQRPLRHTPPAVAHVVGIDKKKRALDHARRCDPLRDATGRDVTVPGDSVVRARPERLTRATGPSRGRLSPSLFR